MEPEPDVTFGPFRLDVLHGWVWRGDHRTPLRPRSLALLRYLLAHPGRLVSKAEVRTQVWGGTHVTDTVLRVCVQEIRAALGDVAAAPRYLETIGRQGYRFLVEGDLESPPVLTASPIVGRQGEVIFLEARYQQAAQGTRQVVFVSGEAGVGKTTVVDLWLGRLGSRNGVQMARGQCVEHYGAGEPYLPILEALGQLSRGPGGMEVVAVLRRQAPLWLVQLPGLLRETELERVQRLVQGATPTRMLRELADALDVLTAETPLMLVLEDLHWSDASTVEALAYVAQRRDPARLLVLGTYRPVETLLRSHPLRGLVQELCGRGQAVDLALELLPAEAVTAYVSGRLGGAVANTLAAFVYERTEGNALFLANILEHLVQQGLVVRQAGQWTLRDGGEPILASLPEGLRQFISRRIEALPVEARRVLEAASVAGEAFPVAVVATAAECPVVEVNAVCEALVAQHHFIADVGLVEWPDGTRSGQYRFQHALYQQVLYERLGPTQRLQCHQRVGARLEAGYGAQRGEIAAQLAVHFERAGETGRAVHAWQQVGETAERRNAPHEAIAALQKALTLLATLPESAERTRHELTLQLRLGEVISAAKGRAALEVGEAYSRADTLCRGLGEVPLRFQVLQGLYRFQETQAQLHAAGELAQQLAQLAQQQPDASLLQEGQSALGSVAFYRGDLVAARTYLEPCLPSGAFCPSSAPMFRGGHHLGVTNLSWMVLVLWGLGYADQAQRRSQEALALAKQMGHPPTLTHAQIFAAMLAQCRRDAAATYARADGLMIFAAAQGLAYRVDQGRFLRGWAQVMQGDAASGVAEIRQGIVAAESAGLKLFQPYRLALLAEAYGMAGQPETGLQILAEALMVVAETDERRWEAEVARLRGALLLQLPSPDAEQAEACFQQALTVACRQQAKALELRAALSLTHLWQQQGKQKAARDLLAPIYGWFTEGFDTPDLQEAKALLKSQ